MTLEPMEMEQCDIGVRYEVRHIEDMTYTQQIGKGPCMTEK